MGNGTRKGLQPGKPGSNTEEPDHNVEATLQRMQLSVAIFPTYPRNSFDEAARAHCVQQVRST